MSLASAYHGKRVLIVLRNKRIIVGNLISSDDHVNLILDEANEINEVGDIICRLGYIFLMGNNLSSISL